MPGATISCTNCGAAVAVSYPAGVMDKLRARGKRFADDSPAMAPAAARAAVGGPQPLPPRTGRTGGSIPGRPARSAPANRSPGGASGRGAERDLRASSRIKRTSPPPPRRTLRGGSSGSGGSGGAPDNRRRLMSALGCLGSFGLIGLAGAFLLVVLGGIAAGGGYWYFSKDLPTVDKLRSYQPATVTVLLDINDVVLGEIYEQRRYVVPTEEIPEHVRQAFLAAEDANFYNHGGVDFMGIVRALGRNVLQGKKAQGASTITQQVARNFLLTRDKTIVRKIKEIILSWRIESAYTKDHILYLYLNEIFLGSQSYGVEAASRTFFKKHIKDVTIAEAAILAGLPPAPSLYNPYKNWDKTRMRQEYVLKQMEQKGFITGEEREGALAEQIVIYPRTNTFLEQAPYFTEHVRRYLVDKYGEERVLNDGLRVKTTCDMNLQVKAQQAVYDGVFGVDQKMGFRREEVENVGVKGIEEKRKELESKMIDAWVNQHDPAKRDERPAQSTIEADKVYRAVLTKVSKRYAIAAIGTHEAVIPLAWSEWVYDPDPRKSWRRRSANNLTQKVRVDREVDGKKKAVWEPILSAGDVVLVKVASTSTREKLVRKAFKGTPGEKKAYVAARLWQEPEVEAALLSMDVATGAVRAMVGGSSFEKTQFNRAVQARRQVGSTFKPLVYTAAIESKRVTAATLIPDAPITFETSQDWLWKPSNYGHQYEGNLTLRQALAKSKNTCTVRVLDAADPGLNDDVIYKFGRKLGIGGPPLDKLPDDWKATPSNDKLCPWVPETSRTTICMDREPPLPEGVTDEKHRARLSAKQTEYKCRACDYSMALGSASLTMEEMVRAYSVFPTGGKLVEPYYLEQVLDRDGQLLEEVEHEAPLQVLDPGVAAVGTWLLQGVVQYGTGVRARKELGLEGLAGKTGTTNEEKDAWFVGFTNDVITAVWVGFDKPRPMGVAFTGGGTALPIWIDYMKEAAPRKNDRPFNRSSRLSWANIDEATGNRLSSGGVMYPFIEGTAPEATGLDEGDVTMQDVGTQL
ncbi:MAG: transglycosylase domain-containing protein [Myxococcota bacterium]